MTDQQYQIGLSTLFIGYVLMQVPSNAMLNYAGRPSIYIGFFVSIFSSGLTPRLCKTIWPPCPYLNSPCEGVETTQ